MDNLNYYIINFDNKNKDKHLSLIQSEIGGGRIDIKTIDNIKDFPEKKEISISGLTQKTFDYFIDKYAQQFKAINFWKCPLISNLEDIATLSNIECITYFWNQRAESFWNFSKTKSLRILHFDDFTKLHDLSELSNASSLIELQFGNKIWSKYILNSLEPISKCFQLKRFFFNAKKIIENRIEPLAKLQNLDEIGFASKLFKTEQVAWLKARLPKTIKSEVLNPFLIIDRPIETRGKKIDTILVGKGKPNLDSNLDAVKIEKYVEEFTKMYEWFLKNSNALPDDYLK
jgi:hypothetical protein